MRDDNQLLVEQRNILEEQLEACRRRNETVLDLENELVRQKQRVTELSQVCSTLYRFVSSIGFIPACVSLAVLGAGATRMQG